MPVYPRTNKDPFKIWNPWWENILVGGRDSPRKAFCRKLGKLHTKEDLKETASGYVEFVFGKNGIVVSRRVLTTQTRNATWKVQPGAAKRWMSLPRIDAAEEVAFYRRCRVAHTPGRSKFSK